MDTAVESQMFDGTAVQVVVMNKSDGRKQRVITLATVADITGLDRETLRNIIKRNPDTFEGWIWSVTLTDHLGRLQPTTVLSRDGTLALLLKINTNQLEGEDRRQRIVRFQRWAATALGEIVEHGMYATDELLDNPDLLVEVATRLRDERRARLAAEAQVKLMAPKAEFHDAVAQVEDGQSVREAAKILGTGQNRLFKWLKMHGYLMGSNEPYQRYLEAGYFKVIEQTYRASEQQHVRPKTLVTGKGLIWLEGQLHRGETSMLRSVQAQVL